MKILTRTIWLLSLVSLFTDMASEMLYPIMPLYLKEIGFSVLLIGVLEGIAEATAGLSKSYFGKRSDQSGKRVPFVQFGYFLSAISKPMMAVFVYPFWVFLARTTDRLGKGIRTGARDAMLSEEATSQTKGRVFGFHRAMDTLGAVVGPALALVYLHFYPQQYKMLFIVAVIPGLLAILLTWMLKEKPGFNQLNLKKEKISLLISFRYWRESPALYRKVVLGLVIFALFNSSDLFLLLKVKEAGLTDTAVIGTYIFYNLVYAVFAYPLGHLSDKIGFRKTLIIGFCFFAMVYAGMAFNHRLEGFYLLFLFYGIYAAATESVAKAWISTICDKKDTATAIGTYTGFQSMCTMLASSLAGLMWLTLGATTTFLITAIIALLVILYLLPIKEFSKNS